MRIMYQYHHPKPIEIKLIDELGFSLREMAAEYVAKNQNTTGAERGNIKEQGYGALAEIVMRNKLGIPEINSAEHSIAFDILLPSSVKADVKCRGGKLPFKEEYIGDDNIAREAKHNFFARQINDENLDTDIYIMTHLETTADGMLPGTKRQRKWTLFLCGWVSKKRVLREGVYLPRGSLTEQGNTWFTYRGQQIEFYNKNLNGIADIKDLLEIDKKNVEQDEQSQGGINMTSVDAIRIGYDLVGRGVLKEKHVKYIKSKMGITQNIKPILHPNQYYHLLKWLKDNDQIDNTEYQKAERILTEEPYSGI